MLELLNITGKLLLTLPVNLGANASANRAADVLLKLIYRI